MIFFAASLFLSTLAAASAFDCDTASCTSTPGTCTPGNGFCTYRYGPSVWVKPGPDYYNQEADLYLPAGFDNGGPVPVVVLVHGGYWYNQYLRASTNGSDMRPLAVDLQARGYAVVNLEYRRASSYTDGNGHFPGTFNDLIDGVDALACFAGTSVCGLTTPQNLDLSKIVMAGHSAGGHLALWRALQHGISSSDRTDNGIATATLEPIAAIGLAAVSDFGGPVCDSDGTASSSAITNLMGMSASQYCNEGIHHIVSPLHMLQGVDNLFNPDAMQLKMVHGLQDTTVSQVQSDRVVVASAVLVGVDAQAGERSGGHFDVIDPADDLWKVEAIGFLEAVAPLTTAPPSKTPTKSPSSAPSAGPTASPSASPSKSPTASPVESTGTKSPSSTPSAGPTASPSASPSKSPTASPEESTSSPSKSPTVGPTKGPSKAPTISTEPPTPICNNNGVCNPGEDCNNCPNDCASKTNGNPNSQYCCDGDIPPDCGSDNCICAYVPVPTPFSTPSPTGTCGAKGSGCEQGTDCCSGNCKRNGSCN